MSPKRKVQRVKVADLKVDPATAPRSDERCIQLLTQAMRGTLPVYLALIPLSLCVPFDQDYKPGNHPLTAKLLEERAASIMEDGSAMIVYQAGDQFIVSDDYITLFAYHRHLPRYVACIVLGKPEHKLVSEIEGPLSLDEVPRALGLE